MRNLCDAAYISCEGAALPFQAHANYGTWSIDFVKRNKLFINIKFFFLKEKKTYEDYNGYDPFKMFI